MHRKVCIIGGGAAGIFAGVICAQTYPDAQVSVLEKTSQFLAKVRISGGGRCNVTHRAFTPSTLIQNYPRGGKELLGPFHRFQPRDIIAWFEERGVRLKTEEDGRIFPVTDSSQTIIEALLLAAQDTHVRLLTGQNISTIEKLPQSFRIHTTSILECDALLLATGSNPQGHSWAKKFGHTIVPPVPSLFTFHVPSSPLLDLSGITLPDVQLTLPDSSLTQRGALLLTHFGFSGPVTLKLSAWAARHLHTGNYHAPLHIHWLPQYSTEEIYAKLLHAKQENPSKGLDNIHLFPLPAHLWKRLVLTHLPSRPLGHLANQALQNFAQQLTRDTYSIAGKTMNKQEFVTAGGVSLQEIDFRTMESRLVKGLYFAGEILDIDGVTGGFNFQNAWTTGWIAGNALGR